MAMDLAKKRIFYIFLLIHTLLWSFVPLMRNLLSIDAMEAISWGELVSFGTNKHPPLSGWLAASFYNVLGHSDLAIYFLGQLFILIGFIYIYKLAKFFLNDEKAFCSVMILEGCYYYTWMPFIDNFNPNVLLLGLWPMIIYYFYKSMKENRLSDWILLGITAGLGFLGKYQSIFLYLPMALYLLAASGGGQQFKRLGLYLAAAISLIIISPHVFWLYQNDFFSFIYMLERTHSETHNLPLILIKLSHLFYPIKFILGQIMAIAGCLIIYAAISFKSKNIRFKNIEGQTSDKLFLIFVGILPMVFQGIMGFITSSRVPSIWGSTMIGFTGILLFYFFPVKFNKDTFVYFTKWVYAAMGATLIAVIIFMQFQTKLFISYPRQTIMQDFTNMWNEETNNAPLKYVGGDINYIFQFRLYNSQHPTVILETFGHSNPWINHEDTIKSGAIILAQDEEDLVTRTKELLPFLPENYEICPENYTIKICNKFNKCKEKDIVFTIIKPIN